MPACILARESNRHPNSLLADGLQNLEEISIRQNILDSG